MLLIFSLLLVLCERTALQSWVTTNSVYFTDAPTTTAAPEEKLSLQLVAIPDYPVAAGQRVNLHCNAFTMPDSVKLSWHRLENQTWQEVANGGDLTLTKPEQSGLYCCRAENQLSQNHTVYIISMHTTVGEYLGIAAFVISLLALIINFAILFWLGWHRLGAASTTSNIAAKGFPGPEKSPKGGLPHTESDGDVYINYTNNRQAYTDLDPTNVTTDNVYSSL
ncbi:uncharacterized protein LOC129103466 [Anoplopoma fimbria]|uniref:uncharacterized protein LOC129103466 n=1 Tax=Anoplopoma fimbria TaxID=229290 RepID=UPI0023EDC1E5|nr:uncharacterized protein LOC129103466 [Anoplopoma fimbria]